VLFDGSTVLPAVPVLSQALMWKYGDWWAGAA